MSDTLSTDVFIVGGGPAGLAASLAARAVGLTVSVADRCTPPFEKACGEGLMPDAIAALAHLGVHLAPGDGAAFDGIRFIDDHTSAEARFPSGQGFGIRRPTLHRVLADHAQAAGVTLVWGAVVDRTQSGEILMNGSPVNARWIVGADGHGSRVRRWARLQPGRQRRMRFGFRQHYRVQPWTTYVEVHWRTNLQFVVTPVGPDDVCVALMTRDPKMRVADALQFFPALGARLQGADSTTVEKGGISGMLSVASVASGKFALIGDASGSVDAITGEGLRLAFQQASCLGRALALNDLALYRAEHRRIARLPMWMSRLMLLMDRNAMVRHSVMRAFIARPRIFARLLAIHTGTASGPQPWLGRGSEDSPLYETKNTFPVVDPHKVVTNGR